MEKSTEKEIITTEECSSETKKEIITAEEGSTEVAVVENERFSSDVKSLLQLIVHPVSTGEGFVRKHSWKAWGFAMLLHAVMVGFFNLSLYHSTNQAILRGLMQIGDAVSKGLSTLSDTLIGALENSLVALLSMIPAVGEAISGFADQLLSQQISHLARYLSLEVRDFLQQLYPALKLPEGLGFLLGLIGTLAGTFLIALIMKLFMRIAKHPFRKYQEMLSLLAIRSMISIPIIFIASILALFIPVIGLFVCPLALLFGISYLYAVLLKSVDKDHENRLPFVFPFIVLVILGIVLLMVAITGVSSGVSIYLRLSEFFQTFTFG